jgi:hypothetical protein
LQWHSIFSQHILAQNNKNSEEVFLFESCPLFITLLKHNVSEANFASTLRTNLSLSGYSQALASKVATG